MNESRKSIWNLWGLLLPPQNIAVRSSVPRPVVTAAAPTQPFPAQVAAPKAFSEAPTRVEPVEPDEPETVKGPIDRFQERLEEADSVDECITLYVNAVPGSVQEKIVLGKIQKLSSTSDDWLSILERVSLECPLGVWATGRLLETVEKLSFSDRVRTIVKIGERTRIGAKLLESVRTATASIREWGDAGEQADDCSDLDKLAAERIAVLPGSLEDFLAIARSNSGDVREAALKRLEEAPGKVEEFKELYDGDDSSEVLEVVCRRIVALTSGIPDLCSLYDDYDSDYIRDAVVERVKTECSTEKELSDALSSADDDSDLHKALFDRLLETSKSIDALVTLYEEANDDDAKDRIMERLKTLTWTVDETEKVLDTASCGSQLEELAFERKVSALADPVALLELYFEIVDDHSDCGLDDVQVEIARRCGPLLTPRERNLVRLLSNKSDGTDFTDIADHIDPKPEKPSEPSE